jgi:flagellar protein FlgJ
MIGPAIPFDLHLSAPIDGSGARDGPHTPSLKDAAQGFESVFLSMLLKEMRQTLEPGSLFGNDSSDVYGGLFDQFMAQHLAQGKGMGLAQSLMKQLEPNAAHGAPHPTSVPGSPDSHSRDL